jgi:hypothetical protein
MADIPLNAGQPGAYALGLPEAEVRRLQDILRRECGVELTLEQAWARGIELLTFAKMILEALPPKTQSPG